MQKKERTRNASSRGLVHFSDASGLHHGGFPLTFGKVLGAFSINIHAGELLTVMVEDSHLPVTMLAPAVPVYATGFLCLFRFHRQ
jgi:hypothetical protein